MKKLLLVAFAATTCLVYLLLLNQTSASSKAVLDMLELVAAIAVGVALVQVIEYFIVDVYLQKANSRDTTDLFQLAISVFLYSLLGVAVAKFGFGLDVTQLLATSAVLSVIVGFALQSTLGNFFSGIAIEIEQPISIGDFVKTGDVEGVVEYIKWRSIFIRSVDDSLIHIPNSEFTNAIFEVRPKNRSTLLRVPFSAPGWVPPSRVIRIAWQVIKNHNILDVESDPPPRVLMRGLDGSSGSVNFELTYASRNVIQRELLEGTFLERLWYALSREGIPMTFYGSGVDAEEHSVGLLFDSPALADSLVNSPPMFTAARGAADTARVDRYKALLSEVQLFSSLTAEELQVLALGAVSYYFTRGEYIDSDKSRYGHLHILASGQIRLENRSEQIAVDVQNKNGKYRFMEKELEHISSSYAKYVGPIAYAAVISAATETNDMFQLYQTLALRINNQQEREKFLSNSPKGRTLDVGKGAVWGGKSFLTGSEEQKVVGSVVSECEVVTVSPSVVSKIIEARPEIIDYLLKAAIQQQLCFAATEVEQTQLKQTVQTFYSSLAG